MRGLLVPLRLFVFWAHGQLNVNAAILRHYIDVSMVLRKFCSFLQTETQQRHLIWLSDRIYSSDIFQVSKSVEHNTNVLDVYKVIPYFQFKRAARVWEGGLFPFRQLYSAYIILLFHNMLP